MINRIFVVWSKDTHIVSWIFAWTKIVPGTPTCSLHMSQLALPHLHIYHQDHKPLGLSLYKRQEEFGWHSNF